MKSSSFAVAAALLRLSAAQPWAVNTTTTASTTVTSTKIETVTALTTYCPHPTTIVQNSKTYTVTAATTLTISDCPCTVTKTYSPAQTQYVQYQAAPPAAAAAAAAGGSPAAAAAAPPAAGAPAGCPAVQTATVTVYANGAQSTNVGGNGAAASPAGSNGAAAPPAGGNGAAPPAGSNGATPLPPSGSNGATPPPAGGNDQKCPLVLPGKAGVDHLVPSAIAQAAAGKFGQLQNGGTVARGNALWFTFQVPQSYEGRQCEIRFALPEARRSEFILNNPDNAQIDFTRRLDPVVAGGSFSVNGSTVLTPWAPPKINGNFLFATRPCPAGRPATYSASTNSSLNFQFMQENSPCALGMFIVPK